MSVAPSGPHRWRLAALSLAMLLPSLSTSIANVTLPALSEAFSASSQDVQWVVIAYLLAVTTLIVAAGRLGDMLGRRRLSLAGIGLFAVASLAAAFAPNLWSLVALRAVQGAGAAVMMSLTMAAVGDMVSRERTGSAMGLLGTVSAVGTALGPSLGGALLSAFGWPAQFAFLAVLGLAALLSGFWLFPPDGTHERKPLSIDLWGMAVLAFTLAAYALATTVDAGPGINIALAVASAVGLVAFTIIEARAAAPLVQLRLLGERTMSSGLLSLGLVSTIMMSTLVVGPFYLSQVLGLTPLQTGLVMSIGPAVAAIVGIPAGRLVDRLSSPAATLAGLTGVTSGSLLMVALPGATGTFGYVLSLAVITAGYALFQAANSAALMTGSARDNRGVTSALLALARNIGLISGASAMGAVFVFGSSGVLHLQPGGQAGMQVTFTLAAGLGGLAIVTSRLGLRGQEQIQSLR